MRPGETVHNLSKRFGVPSAEILKANGMASGDQLAAGQKVVIPTYAYSRKAAMLWYHTSVREAAKDKSEDAGHGLFVQLPNGDNNRQLHRRFGIALDGVHICGLHRKNSLL